MDVPRSQAAVSAGTSLCTDTTTAPMSTVVGDSMASSHERGRRVTTLRSQPSSQDMLKPHATAVDGESGWASAVREAAGIIATSAEAIS
jgi:hypothetical protein